MISLIISALWLAAVTGADIYLKFRKVYVNKQHLSALPNDSFVAARLP